VSQKNFSSWLPLQLLILLMWLNQIIWIITQIQVTYLLDHRQLQVRKLYLYWKGFYDTKKI
jgi:hypothetical protein